MTGHAALWYAGTDRKCTESLYKLIVGYQGQKVKKPFMLA